MTATCASAPRPRPSSRPRGVRRIQKNLAASWESSTTILSSRPQPLGLLARGVGRRRPIRRTTTSFKPTPLFAFVSSFDAGVGAGTQTSGHTNQISRRRPRGPRPSSSRGMRRIQEPLPLARSQRRRSCRLPSAPRAKIARGIGRRRLVGRTTTPYGRAPPSAIGGSSRSLNIFGATHQFPCDEK